MKMKCFLQVKFSSNGKMQQDLLLDALYTLEDSPQDLNFAFPTNISLTSATPTVVFVLFGP